MQLIVIYGTFSSSSPRLEVFSLPVPGQDSMPRECRRFVEIQTPARRFALKPLARNGFPCSRDPPNPSSSTHRKAVFWESLSIRRTTYSVTEMNYFRQICVFLTTKWHARAVHRFPELCRT